MKKSLCVLLSLIMVLSAGFAMAEERTRTILMQGDEEDITEARFVSDYGYEIWYDINAFKLDSLPDDGFDEFTPVDPDALPPVTFTVVAVELPADEVADLIEEAAADHKDAGWEMSEIGKDKLDSGLEYRVCEGIKDGVVLRLYQISGSKGSYSISATFPEDSIEGYGARIDIMVKTLEG